MKLMHFSKHQQIDLHHVEQLSRGDKNYFGMKPKGFWVTDEDDYGWAQWCHDEECDFLGEHVFNVELAEDHNLLILTTPDQINDFNAQYRMQVHSGLDWEIDWPTVAKQYQGIIISPYQWSLRLSDVSWYYSWDCASGCIWDPAAIKSITPIDWSYQPEKGEQDA